MYTSTMICRRNLLSCYRTDDDGDYEDDDDTLNSNLGSTQHPLFDAYLFVNPQCTLKAVDFCLI